ncbi:hypothetical protein [Arcobacter sp. L]|uniref:hypothetical protein n=1 Tax=Arcobacter sp. L TaxID=944547 RepID=UPI000229582D|nr:hypothetical protein [Arcobacter sp. L]BAK72013.1 conserved hypothetical protein [Arcobacter sp. L]
MSLLQYTSNEMYSSTELVRKSKYIFDKLNKKEIEKAIILRDGKPGVIILDFNEYERIIADYLKLKNKQEFPIEKKDYSSQIKEDKIQIKNKDKIEEIDFNFDSDSIKEKEEPLKEFWD